jgi:hypothetical protein
LWQNYCRKWKEKIILFHSRHKTDFADIPSDLKKLVRVTKFCRCYTQRTTLINDNVAAIAKFIFFHTGFNHLTIPQCFVWSMNVTSTNTKTYPFLPIAISFKKCAMTFDICWWHRIKIQALGNIYVVVLL